MYIIYILLKYTYINHKADMPNTKGTSDTKRI